jgi:hypothetical protein
MSRQDLRNEKNDFFRQKTSNWDNSNQKSSIREKKHIDVSSIIKAR